MVRTNDDAPNCSAGTAPRQDQLPRMDKSATHLLGLAGPLLQLCLSNPAQPYPRSSSRGIQNPITGATIL